MELATLCALFSLLMLTGTGASEPGRPNPEPSLEIYKKLFAVKRKDQLKALKNLVELNDVHQQYKIIDVMLKGLFQVLEDSRAALLASDIFPDGPLPEDEKLKDAFSHVLENTAFFGDVALRFPKIVHHYFDRNANWNYLIRWGISFCNQSGVFEQGSHAQLLGLASGELGAMETMDTLTELGDELTLGDIDGEWRVRLREDPRRAPPPHPPPGGAPRPRNHALALLPRLRPPRAAVIPLPQSFLSPPPTQERTSS
ncbi:coiled-coil domain-containing protein 134 [Gracilinanus agilis]|uniref:coiled-coil domain-containing protein 134 n=1 Tax=Gracilinanus agilis TaxID=191870 RepID=UPI001CFD97FC|nr:coiled-coil domain-containing protein 134 [Gracilinanus agilis]